VIFKKEGSKIKIEVILVVVVVLNLIGMTVAAWYIMRRK